MKKAYDKQPETTQPKPNRFSKGQANTYTEQENKAEKAKNKAKKEKKKNRRKKRE